MYGYTIMNKSKHLSVDFCSEERVLEMVNDPRFMSLEEYDGCYEVNIWELGILASFQVYWGALDVVLNLYNKILCVSLKYLNTTLQVTSKKKSIKHNLPIQIGFFVYQYAKLRMLEFFFDVIDKFISRDDYCLLEMDTGDFG